MYGDVLTYFIIYTYIESFCCISETNVILFKTSVFLKKLILRGGFLENIIDYSPSKSSLFAPNVALCSPLWSKRSNQGRKEPQKQVDF